MLLTGLLQATGLVFISVAFNIMIRFATLAFNIEAVVFACVSVVSAALILSIFAGPGRLVNATLKTPATWAYGVSTIGVFVIDIYLSKYVSATEMSLFGRMAIPISLLVSILIFKRHQMKNDLFGLIFVLAGLYLLFSIQDSSVITIIAILAIATGLVQAGEVIFSEVHKQSQKAHETGNIRDRARVVGFVSFVTSMMFLGVVFIFSILHQYVWPDAEILAFLPELNRFAHPPSIWFGIFFGVFLSSTYRYFLWSSSYRLKSDNILALLAFVPLLTFGCEWALSYTPWFAGNEAMFEGSRWQILLIICVIITYGSAISVFLRIRSAMKKERTGNFWKDVKKAITIDTSTISSIQHASNAMDDYEIICSTLEHTDDDMDKAAEMLHIPVDTLRVLHESKGSLALVSHASQELTRNYRHNVANKDMLTGLLNRGGFMLELRHACEKEQPFHLFFIDLDKFKPVNDTYGHDVGDIVLKQVSQRLKDSLVKGDVVTRLGGDEYCILQSKIKPEEVKAKIKSLVSLVSQPFKIDGIRKYIRISASVGVAAYPDDATDPDELLQIADISMYDDKGHK